MSIQSKIQAETADAQMAARHGSRVPMDESTAALARARQAQESAGEPRPAGRPADRIPFGGAEQQLAYPDRDGYRNYWVNDTPGRIARAKAGGYAHVLENGEPVSRIVGRGVNNEGLKAYLMEIPREWYRDDTALQQDALEAKLHDIRNGRFEKQDGQYVPNQGIRVDMGNRR